ncbi:MAG: TIGR04283 family arsenosugar biosynthesis glycosyltransferase [Flavobacteriaceae bacterium]|nr:TIGR04283 family arsenosugar biosynthesis glycosyltransferase [Flavobacteriaceae bacterium]
MISIIIPVLNESQTILKLLSHLSKKGSPQNVSEIIVVDGGSTDGTIDLVNNFLKKSSLNIFLITSEKGRAKQMNVGAKKSSGQTLYFLHADSFPPKNFDMFIISALKDGAKAGSFRMRFDSNHPMLKFSQWFTQFNYKFCRGGDQSLFITKEAFDQLQGYTESYIIYEDCEFISRVYNSYKFVVMKGYVTTSARKYKQNGTMKLQYHFSVIHLKKMFGASAENLSDYYQKYIAS